MRTVITLAVGFWLGRQVYIKYDKKKVQQREQQVKSRLETFLKQNGLTKTEVNSTINEIIN